MLAIVSMQLGEGPDYNSELINTGLKFMDQYDNFEQPLNVLNVAYFFYVAAAAFCFMARLLFCPLTSVSYLCCFYLLLSGWLKCILKAFCEMFRALVSKTGHASFKYSKSMQLNLL